VPSSAPNENSGVIENRTRHSGQTWFKLGSLVNCRWTIFWVLSGCWIASKAIHTKTRSEVGETHYRTSCGRQECARDRNQRRLIEDDNSPTSSAAGSQRIEARANAENLISGGPPDFSQQAKQVGDGTAREILLGRAF